MQKAVCDDARKTGFVLPEELQTQLALEAVAKAENIEVTDEEIEAEYTRISEAYNVPADQVKAMVSTEDIKADMLVANAMKFVKDNAVVAKASSKKAAAKKSATKKTTTRKTKKEAAE